MADDELRRIREERARQYQQHLRDQQASVPAGAPAPAAFQGGALPPPHTPPTTHATAPAATIPPPAPPPAAQPAPTASRMIGLPGQNANLTSAELEQRQRAADKNRELEEHHRSYDDGATRVRPAAASDQDRMVRLSGDDDVDVGAPPDLSDMLREAVGEMQAAGINVDLGFEGMEADIEREIDEAIRASGAQPDASGNVLQIFDAQGHDLVNDNDYAEAFDPQNTGGASVQGRAHVDFDKYSLVSTLANARQLPVDNRACAVCQEELRDGQVIRRLNCFHVFHKDCIDEWLRRCAKCPVCKHEFDEGQQLMDAVNLKEPSS